MSAVATASCVWIGAYEQAGAAGLTPMFQDGAGWRLGEPYVEARNASFGVYSPRFDVHYLVDECEAGAVGVYRRQNGGWRKLASVPTFGALPCHLALDPDEERLAVANYGDGSVALFSLEPNRGVPLMPPAMQREDGHGPNAKRQEGPHAHWVGFTREPPQLLEVNLGVDAILAFPFDPKTGLGEETPAYRAPAGSGPRQLALHPRLPVAYLVSELDSTLATLERQGGGFVRRGLCSTLPKGFDGQSLGGAVALNAAGDRLYVSNRGHDSIAVFSLDGAGDPALIQHAFPEGESPRFILLDEGADRLFVAHEKAGGVAVMDLAPDGRIGARQGGVDLPGAAFLFTAGPA